RDRRGRNRGHLRGPESRQAAERANPRTLDSRLRPTGDPGRSTHVTHHGRSATIASMRDSAIRIVGAAAAVAYAVFIAWVSVSQPRSMAEVTGGLTASIGAYRIDEVAFDDGLAFFRADKFVEARAAFARADPAMRDPLTQFYVAYSYYRQGWGRLSSDDDLFRQGIAAVDRARAVAPDGRIVVDDETLGLRTADELRAELEAGITREMSDFNP